MRYLIFAVLLLASFAPGSDAHASCIAPPEPCICRSPRYAAAFAATVQSIEDEFGDGAVFKATATIDEIAVQGDRRSRFSVGDVVTVRVPDSDFDGMVTTTKGTRILGTSIAWCGDDPDDTDCEPSDPEWNEEMTQSAEIDAKDTILCKEAPKPFRISSTVALSVMLSPECPRLLGDNPIPSGECHDTFFCTASPGGEASPFSALVLGLSLLGWRLRRRHPRDEKRSERPDYLLPSI